MYTLNFMGKDYPLRYTTRAARKIMEIWNGKIDNTGKVLPEVTLGEYRETQIKILAVLVQEGAAFERVFNGSKIEAPTEEMLMLGIKPNQADDLSELTSAAITEGKARTVTIEVDTKKQTKNA